ncbi:MAG TPA: aldo/keto reductase, partial [Gemmatimonadales bacterium]|nr:aldo/keto reductase [Gemmatimonadales bacterium]
GGLVRPDSRWVPDARPEQLRAACDRSLAALGVERIDLYQLHAPDPKVPFEESIGALAGLRKAGKVRWVGLSNVSVEQIERARRIVPIVTVQNRLNPFFRDALTDGVLAHCAEQGIGFLAYSPTGGGRLTLKLPTHPILQPMAARLGVTTHALVIAWALSRSPGVIPIPSARRVEHALDSVSAAELELSAEDLAAIDRAEFSRA